MDASYVSGMGELRSALHRPVMRSSYGGIIWSAYLIISKSRGARVAASCSCAAASGTRGNTPSALHHTEALILKYIILDQTN